MNGFSGIKRFVMEAHNRKLALFIKKNLLCLTLCGRSFVSFVLFPGKFWSVKFIETKVYI